MHWAVGTGCPSDFFLDPRLIGVTLATCRRTLPTAIVWRKSHLSREISLIGAGAWRARGGSANQDPVWGSGDTGRSEKVVGPVSTVVEFVAACRGPPPDWRPACARRTFPSHDARGFFFPSLDACMHIANHRESDAPRDSYFSVNHEFIYKEVQFPESQLP